MEAAMDANVDDCKKKCAEKNAPLFSVNEIFKESMKKKFEEAIKRTSLPIQDYINELKSKVEVLENLKMISNFRNKELAEENDRLRKKIEVLKKCVEDFKAREKGNEKGKGSKDICKAEQKPKKIVEDKEEQVDQVNDEDEQKKSKEKHLAAIKTGDVNKIVLKGVSKEILNFDLKKLVVDIGRKIKIKMRPNQIVTVEQLKQKYFERQKMMPNKIILVVDFTSHSLKLRFLKSKELLKQNTFTENFEIVDYVSEDTYDLYQYAKNLKTCGFAAVYWRNDNVYAKRSLERNSKEFDIRTFQDVDKLMSLHSAKGNDKGDDNESSHSEDDSENDMLFNDNYDSSSDYD